MSKKPKHRLTTIEPGQVDIQAKGEKYCIELIDYSATPKKVVRIIVEPWFLAWMALESGKVTKQRVLRAEAAMDEIVAEFHRGQSAAER